MAIALQKAGEQRNAALLFILSCLWIAASITGGRIVSTLAPPLVSDAIRQCMTAVLLFVGLYVIARSGINDLRPLSSVGFVRRPSARREFALGLALGWGTALTLILPAVLTGNLSLDLTFGSAHLLRFVLSSVTLAAFALSVQLIVAGLPSRLLIRTAGSFWTVAAMMLLAFCLVLSGWAGEDSGIVFAILAAVLFTTAFLRTRAVWFALGLHLGWILSLQLLFGESSPYTPVSSGIVQAEIVGRRWLTGAPTGPEASAVAPVILIIALIVLFRMTRDYAWQYPYQPVEGAGYPVEIHPPAEHEHKQERGVEQLVQIGGVIPYQPLPRSETQQ